MLVRFVAITVTLLVVLPAKLSADDPAPRKVALLVGVNKYLKPGFNDLQFAEADVTAVGNELDRLGFSVTVLLGSGTGDQQATRANIEAVARRMVAPLGKNDIALVMLSGHGQQLLADPNDVDITRSQSYYCPVDARLNDPNSQVSLSHLLDDILALDVGRKILLVDACRDIPADSSRGSRNAKGIEGRRINLPEGTGVYFSCSAGQMSFEKAELGHGLFTFCVLEGLRGEAASAAGDISWSRLVAHVDDRMTQPDLVKLMPPQLRQVPIPSGALPQTVLGHVQPRTVVNVATPAPRVMPTSPAVSPAEPPPAAPNLGQRTIEGSKAGEVQTFGGDLAIKMCWCPPGSFVMGSPASEIEAWRKADPTIPEHWYDNQRQVNVTLTRGFWMAQTELTRGQWQSVAPDVPWSDDPYLSTSGKDGPMYPAVDITWKAAMDYCRLLTAREIAAGRLLDGWEYTLPTEAQWEYACRAGTTGPYNGDGTGVLGDYAWYERNAGSMWSWGSIPPPPGAPSASSNTPPRPNAEDYAHLVAQKRPNRWGLYDMHGNVEEWCLDYYNKELPGGSDPLMTVEFATRITRGGFWHDGAEQCRSGMRGVGDVTYQSSYQGMRLVLAPAGNAQAAVTPAKPTSETARPLGGRLPFAPRSELRTNDAPAPPME
jgi:sulfatase modifying factor 1